MKTIKNRIATLFGVLILVFMLVIPTEVFSQGPPPWAPAHGYRAKTRHIYFPNQNMYYDIQKGVYIYFNNGKWAVSVKVPSIFVGINLGRSTQVELDFYGDSPQRYNYSHKTKYKKNKGNASVNSKSKGNGHPGKGKNNNGRGKGK
ncbi:hypothetical protein [Flavobacterium lacisediminis]|uniref:DUF3300 domain-containing protein n=1 Tax=Flavobacterium lacisediminis TaxID=2989705 RepID=A0ABT3EJ35_9FLAO|nr:hypothetical protein [Flavobacterium lacisediminis]MCW1148577.1 hypothetical protein [Flavobacterium lacisediminis]